MENNDEHVVSRRTVMKRLGAGAAIAWSAPVISSLSAPAYAHGYPGPGPGTCQPGQDSCDGADFNCNGLARCFCTGTAEGGLACGCFDRGGCDGYELCINSTDCPAGEFCSTTGTPDCCDGICLQPCSPQCGGGQPAGGGRAAPGVPPTV